ncbi:MAG: hypothetical protein M1839_008540 [Geoglossum umbratile]|nr:MAG: hypothetical protein M1839_008540 [Geoglossum umbratile]
MGDVGVHFRYPTRMLDLRNGMVILRENIQPQRYACLSHCWGPAADIVKTTVENLEEFKIKIPWDRLTTTYKHAVDICQRLDISFLWIDSLCIIQDSKDDWKEEAANMANIYENAFITIAAGRAPDTLAGCYSKTDPEFIANLVPGYHDAYIRQEPPKFPTHWGERDRSGVWPLLNRGWVYQEMRLSRRVLHFCSQEVMWECHTVRKSESGCSDEDLDSDLPRYGWTKYENVPYWKLTENPRLLWYRTVQEYSRLKLTFEEDKMPALAALTQRMEILRVGDRFLAGLWEKTLLLDLLWMVWPSPTRGIPSIRRAPTWSWASVQSQVMWDSAQKSTLSSIQVLDIHYVAMGPSHMGDISEASITLSAPLIRAEDLFEKRLRTCHKRDHDWDSTEELASPSLKRDSDRDLAPEIAIYDYKQDYVSRSAGEHDGASEAEIFFIPIGSASNDTHSGIQVRKKQGSPAYERIGYVEFMHHKAIEKRREEEKMDYMYRKQFMAPLIERMDFIFENLPCSTIILV